MLHPCSCIAVVSEASEITEAMQRLQAINIDSEALSLINQDTDPVEMELLLSEVGVPKGSRYCYQCMIEAGLMLCVVRGDAYLVEKAGEQLEKMEQLDISIHLDIPPKSVSS